MHIPFNLPCGLANFDIAHWRSFLESTADWRVEAKLWQRAGVGHARVPGAYFAALLNTEIAVPLSIAHDKGDSHTLWADASA
ncbi:hypothetical protein BC827DRAFT_1234016 [Russula dissimulans]|nr:hypothetical protein BC827DRAFT_1234016 [Russula dissimulans]